MSSSSSSRTASSVVARAISFVLNQGYQISPDILKVLQERLSSRDDFNIELILASVVEEKGRRNEGSRMITLQDLFAVYPDLSDVISSGITKEEGKEKSENEQYITGTESGNEFEVIEDPSEKVRPTGTEGFAQLFKSRYEKLSKIFMERPEGRRVTKITKLDLEKGGVKITGLVLGRRPTKNGVELLIDDDTGRATVLALSEEAKKLANQVSLDQAVMLDIEGSHGRLILKNVIHPDLPNRISSTSKKTVYAVFLSDLHIGSNKFLEGAFNRFLSWLKGEWEAPGSKDEDILERLKYIIIGGDVVDGVGIFPNQEYELIESNIYKQYEMVSLKLKELPAHLRVLVIPGNHDSTRQALPQPMIPRKYAESLYGLKNVTMLGDPCFVKLHGVSILVYHGRSLDDVLATTPGLSYERPTEAMKVLLKARHLAPIFGSRTPIAPEVEDYLVIDQVPDIFHAGHVHSVGVESYKSTLIINSGTWQAQTGYQANLGISPRPGLVPIVNLATLDVTFREFLTSG